jgi:putative membrane protein
MVGLIGYLVGVRADRRGGWPTRRTLCWLLAMLAAVAAVTGPLAEAAHHSFTAHMVTHLLLGMLAPLLLVLAAPVTLVLRASPVRRARQLTGLLASPPLRVLTDPVVAAGLNVGSLWLLYTTNLFTLMHEHPLLHLLVHVHMLATGWLFTVALVSVDPVPHRRSYPVRAAVLVAALAGHDILAKYLYAHPPTGVADAELGAMIMYYGGDAIHLVLIVMLCAGWYRLAGRRLPATPVPPLSGAGGAAPRG